MDKEWFYSLGRVQQAVTRVTGSGSREVGAEKFQCLSATSSGCWFPKSQSLPMVGGTLMALIHIGPKCPHARPVLGPCLNIQKLPCFLLMTQEMCSVCLGLMAHVCFTWVSLLSLFLSLSPLVLLGQVRRSSACSSAFPCWTGQRATG